MLREIEDHPSALYATPQSNLPVATRRQVLKVRQGQALWCPDDVATEWPLTLLVDSQELATLVCTPSDLHDLVRGYLVSEGIVRSLDDLADVAIDVHNGTAHVATRIPDDTAQARQNLMRRVYLTSCCGRGRASFYFTSDATTVAPLPNRGVDTAGVRFDVSSCLRLIDHLQQQSVLFNRTGGVHNACLATATQVIVCRADVGRHNALDKLYGHALATGLDASGLAVGFSGRVSSEIVLKVARLGVGLIVSKSAPSELGLTLAEELNMTVVGFVRGDGLNIYTHPDRLDLSGLE